MNDYTYHVGWVVCLSLGGGRLRVCSFLRWSSTGGAGVCISAETRMGIVCVSLRHTSTYHRLPHFNSEPLQSARQSTRLKRLQCTQGILMLILAAQLMMRFTCNSLLIVPYTLLGCLLLISVCDLTRNNLFIYIFTSLKVLGQVR